MNACCTDRQFSWPGCCLVRLVIFRSKPKRYKSLAAFCRFPDVNPCTIDSILHPVFLFRCLWIWIWIFQDFRWMYTCCSYVNKARKCDVLSITTRSKGSGNLKMLKKLVYSTTYLIKLETKFQEEWRCDEQANVNWRCPPKSVTKPCVNLDSMA